MTERALKSQTAPQLYLLWQPLGHASTAAQNPPAPVALRETRQHCCQRTVLEAQRRCWSHRLKSQFCIAGTAALIVVLTLQPV